MLSKKEVKYIQSLCHKAQRDQDRVFVAEGPKLVEELLAGNCSIVNVYALKQWTDTHAPANVSVTEINESDLERISQLSTPNQVLAVVKQMETPAQLQTTGQLTLVLDGIQDPGNLGTIFRIADWFGIKQVVCSTDCADRYNSKVVQSTMGSIARVQCWYTDLNEWLPGTQVPVYGALLQGDNIYAKIKISEGILVIGNESKGIREPLLPFISHPVTIPKKGDAESLNAAVATGIILSHLVG